LSYRSVPWQDVPAQEQAAVDANRYRIAGALRLVSLDDALDRRLGHLPLWYADRHPNFDGYRVLGELSARFLGDCLRAARPAR
jgi:hypothetical protein